MAELTAKPFVQEVAALCEALQAAAPETHPALWEPGFRRLQNRADIMLENAQNGYSPSLRAARQFRHELVRARDRLAAKIEEYQAVLACAEVVVETSEALVGKLERE